MLRQRIEAICERHGVLYSWWVPATSYVAQVGLLAVALVLRDAFVPPDPLLLTLLLIAAGPVLETYGRVTLPWWLDPLGPIVAAAWLLTAPGASGAFDTAPALLALMVAQTVARDGVRAGGAVAAVSAALIVTTPFGPALTLGPVHLVDLLLGFVVGAMLRAQMRALVAERDARARAWQQATAAERERIAREVHDLVAHSLSVTLLHITGARHALKDLHEPTDDVEGAAAEVDAALADAEQVGRRAMADIRRTVSALADEPSSPHALPTAADIRSLVTEVDHAGLHVEYDETGDPRSLPPAAGLGLYRIAQESLTNVAKHAPRSTARVRLGVGPRGAHLIVRNDLDGVTPRPGEGSGLAGMHARAAQLGATLTAGREGGEWVVDVRLRPDHREIRMPCGRSLAVPGDALRSAAGEAAGTGPAGTGTAATGAAR